VRGRYLNKALLFKGCRPPALSSYWRTLQSTVLKTQTAVANYRKNYDRLIVNIWRRSGGDQKELRGGGEWWMKPSRPAVTTVSLNLKERISSKIRNNSNAWHMPRDLRILRLTLEIVGNICDYFTTCNWPAQQFTIQ
jgi:hypothetical protein